MNIEQCKKIYPVTYLDRVYQDNSTVSLETLLSMVQHVYSGKQKSLIDAIHAVPEIYRHENIIMSYVEKESMKTYQFIGDSASYWFDETKWIPFKGFSN